MLFDMFDGQVARMARVTSDFGAQLDSLCDVVSFGVAPGILLVKMCPQFTEVHSEAIWCIAALFACCAAMRLARFNVEADEEDDHSWFEGLPSPAAAAVIASFAAALLHASQRTSTTTNFQTFDWWLQRLLPLVALVVALLMVSRIPYPHVVTHTLRGQKSFPQLVAIVFALMAAWARAVVRRAGRSRRRTPWARRCIMRGGGAARRRRLPRAEGEVSRVFTGLVQALGEVRRVDARGAGRAAGGARRGDRRRGAGIGDSIAINGCCLTVVAIDGGEMAFEAGAETLQRTNLGRLRPGDRVNLEASLRVGDSLGGHLVDRPHRRRRHGRRPRRRRPVVYDVVSRPGGARCGRWRRRVRSPSTA